MTEQYPGSDRFIDLPIDDGAMFRLRPLTRADRNLLEEGISKLSGRSRYLRFFSGFHSAPPSILDSLTNVDGQNHIAWAAEDLSQSEPLPVAAVHAIQDPKMYDCAEVALAVLDEYQHRGLARLLLGAVILDAKRAGYAELCAEVLSENKPAAALFRSLGGKSATPPGGVISLEFSTDEALENLQAMGRPKALSRIFE